MSLPLILRAEIIAGTAAMEAAGALCLMAWRLDCLVTADFQGVALLATPASSADQVIEAWRTERLARLGQVKPGEGT